jgi:PAS domain S-box-containing protein
MVLKMAVLAAPCGNAKNRVLRLLVVEQDHAVWTQIHEGLSKSGYEVLSANAGAEALQILQSEDLPTLAILDWSVDSGDIWHDIPRLKKRTYLYVIVLLTWEQREQRVQALASGADDCVYKSTDMEQLYQRVQFGSRVILDRALRDSEERFRIAFEQSASGMAMVNLSSGRFVHVNRALCNFLGYGEEELLAKDITSIGHPENVPDSPSLAAQLARGEFDGEEIERRYIRKDHAVVWALVSISLVRDEAGRCTYAAAQFKDITKRKLAEEAQQRAEVFAQAIIDKIDDLVMVVDAERKCRYASPSHLASLGYAPSELIGKDGFCTLHPDDWPTVTKHMQQTLRSESSGVLLVRRLHKSGAVLHFEARASLIRGLCGALDGIVVVSRGIDARLVAEQKLRQASAETELFLQSIPSILIGLDAKGHITRWNRSAAEVFGLSTDDVLGRPIDNCGIQWLHPGMNAEVARWLQTESSYRCEDMAYERGKSRHYAGFNVRRIEGDASREPRFILTGAEVTDRKALEEQLRQAQKLEAIGQLAAGIAHEINTPTQYVGDNTRFLQDSWGTIANLLQLSRNLRQQAEAGETAKELLEKFDQAVAESDLDYLLQEVPRAIEQSLDGVQRVAKIVRAMKDFSHPGSQEKRAVNINKAIESTVAVARHEWKYVATVVTEFQEDLPPVPCLIGEFNQVILNLIINAAHAIAAAGGEGQQEKGTITIRTRRQKEWAEIAVEDTGTGIPAEIGSRIFEPFFTTKPVGQGTGQGLALAHSVIVKLHQGQIWFESEVGRGTTFFLRLPLQAEAKTHEQTNPVC